MTDQALSLYDSKDDLATDAESWSAKACALAVVDRESCVHAANLLKSIKLLRSQVQAWFAPHVNAAMATKRKAEEARKALADERDKMEAPLVEAESTLKRALLMFEAKEEARRLDEEHRLQAEAQTRAEQLTLAAAESMAAEGLRTGDVGLIQEADDILAQPVEAPVVSVASTMPKVQGISYTDHWKAHSDIDVKALAADVVSGKAPATFLVPDTTAINAFGRATKGTVAIAGIRWFNDRSVNTRG